jgi:hypothetical protein
MERILMGTRKGDEDWQEQIITTDETRFAAARRWALDNGFDRIRVADIDLDTPPDFAGTVRL